MTTYRTLWQTLTPLYDDNEAKAVVRLLLETRFSMTYTDMLCGGLEKLDASQQAGLASLMHRLAEGEPVQYVMGEAEFGGRTFHVEPGVLIPRPETAELCQLIIQAHNQVYCALQPPAPLQILDIGTGSGCIAVTLAKGIDNAEVTAWDVSPDALLVARGNALTHDANVNMVLQDALQAPEDHDRWDVIVSNPPYITAHERHEIASHVLDHEPHIALFVPDEDPLRFYRAIAIYARHALKEDGTLYFEINPLYAQEMSEMLHQQGFACVDIIPDQYGKQRICRVQR